MTTLSRPSFLALFAIVAGVFVFSSSAQAATSTICGSGCDYLNLEEAIGSDVAGQDTFILTNGYDATEPFVLVMPDDTTLLCDPGVVFGNEPDDIHPDYLYFGDNNHVKNCTFQNIYLFYQYDDGDVNHVSNLSFIENLFLDNGISGIVMRNASEFIISDNYGLQNITLNGGKNGAINNNDMECRNISPCLEFYNAPDNIVIDDNIMTEYRNNSPQISLVGATNITFTNNQLQAPIEGGSQLFLDDVDNMTIEGNLFLFREDGAGGIFVTGADVDMSLVITRNTFIRNGGQDAYCFNLSPWGAASPRVIDVEFTYNLCDTGAGIQFSYDSSFYTLNVTDEYNGFDNEENAIYDNYFTYTLSPTTVYGEPVFRTENVDLNDDFLPVPMSRHLDVNGTIDIGAFDAGARINDYTIDDDCIVDYTTCHSQNIGVLDHVTMNGDNVTIAAGTYPGLSISDSVSNLTVQGAGPTTIFDGSLNFQSALSITDISDSSFSGLSLVNSTETPALVVSSITMSLAILSFGGNDYDDAGGVLLFEDLLMNTSSISADGDPVNVDGVTSINAFLFDLGGVYYTILAPENVADSILEMQAFVGIAPTHFIEDFFIANGDGTYTFSSTNLDNQGITLAAGMTNPPTLVGSSVFTRSYNSAGLKLDNANNNTFENLFIGNNDVGVLYVNGATGNSIEDTIFDTNITQDIVSNTSGGTNDLVNALFTRTMSVIDDGTVRVFYDASVRVVDPLLTPLDGVGVQFLSSNGLTNINATTNALGLTPEVETLAYLMTPSSIALTSGDYNPFTITAFNNGIYPTTSTPATLSEISVFEVMMSQAPVAPPTGGGGGGGLPSIDPRTGTYPPIEPVEPTAPTTPIVKETKIHMLVKLTDDRNPETQEDSTVYYIGADKKRHIIPNESVFNSWYCDFSKVVITDKATLVKYPLGSNVTYRPGLNLVKFPTNPRVYIVQAGRLLRPIKDEASATAMFSSQWAKLVHDLPDTSYGDYVFGDEIPEMTDLSSLNLSPSYPSGEMNIEGYYEIVTGGQECR